MKLYIMVNGKHMGLFRGESSEYNSENAGIVFFSAYFLSNKYTNIVIRRNKNVF